MSELITILENRLLELNEKLAIIDSEEDARKRLRLRNDLLKMIDQNAAMLRKMRIDAKGSINEYE